MTSAQAGRRGAKRMSNSADLAATGESVVRDTLEEGELPHLVLVGGFLGAGKTSLILKAAQMLRGRGQRVAVIVNDQDAGLVDYRHALAHGIDTREVAGGCFCCRFSDLIDAAGELAAYHPQVIFAEPVGSCVDLSATILQPLRYFHRHAYRTAPLTVLVDPAMLHRVEQEEMHPDIEFLFRKQLAEADLVCLTKSDCYSEPPLVSLPADFSLSARTGSGVERWLDEVLASRRAVGSHLLDLDYKRYAEAEAALGWLNLQAHLHLAVAASPALVVGPMLDRLERQLSRASIQIAHLKIFDDTSCGWLRAGISGNGEEADPEGDLLAEPVRDHQLAINLRAVADPATLREIVQQVIEDTGGCVQILHLGAFRPAAPVPQHRFAQPVDA